MRSVLSSFCFIPTVERWLTTRPLSTSTFVSTSTAGTSSRLFPSRYNTKHVRRYNLSTTIILPWRSVTMDRGSPCPIWSPYRIVNQRNVVRSKSFVAFGLGSVLHLVGMIRRFSVIVNNEGNDEHIFQLSTGNSDFKYLIENSSAFVDKTLLIGDWLSCMDNVTAVTYPRRWGKSMNLSMLHYFLAMEIDTRTGKPKPTEECSSYPYFNGGKVSMALGTSKQLSPLAITHHPLYHEHYKKFQHQYPVISLNLQSITSSSTIDGLVSRIQRRIRLAYGDHTYLRPYLKEYEKIRFDKFVEGHDCTKEDLIDSIEYLSELLYSFFGRRSIILIDEYDTPLNYAFMNLETNERLPIVNFFRDFYGTTLKDNKFMERGFLTGILRITQAQILSGINNLQEYNMNDPNYAAYYGFTESEVNGLFKVHRIPGDFANRIKQWYNGYTVNGYQIYNPWSIINVIKAYHSNLGKGSSYRGILKNYWCESGYFGWTKMLLKQDEFASSIERLLLGKSISFALRETFTMIDIQAIKTVSEDETTISISPSFPPLIFSYLYWLGYLTRSTVDGKFILPNIEMKNYLRNELTTYYTDRYGENLPRFANVANALGKLVEADTDTQSMAEKYFVEVFHALLQSFPSFGTVKYLHPDTSTMVSGEPVIHGNEHITHSILNCAVVGTFGLETFAADTYLDKSRRPDIVFVTGNTTKQAVIIELKFEKTADEALRDIEVKRYAKEIVQHYPVFLLGLNVAKDKTVTLKYKKIPQGSDI